MVGRSGLSVCYGGGSGGGEGVEERCSGRVGGFLF